MRIVVKVDLQNNWRQKSTQFALFICINLILLGQENGVCLKVKTLTFPGQYYKSDWKTSLAYTGYTEKPPSEILLFSWGGQKNNLQLDEWLQLHFYYIDHLWSLSQHKLFLPNLQLSNSRHAALKKDSFWVAI